MKIAIMRQVPFTKLWAPWCALLLAGMLWAWPVHAELEVYDTLGGDFTLDSSEGRPRALSDFSGKVVLLFFGYTACPDICPTTMVRVQQAVRRLEADEAAQVQVLFISVDPERDFLERLREYVTYFDPRFIGLTGDSEQLMKIARQYGAFFVKDTQTQTGAGYLMAHSGYTYLLDGQGRVRALYRQDATPAKMADDIEELLDEL